ncbi:MAG: ankyrin repeat domain-containing protein [Candidatus Latescibacterota bacterium]
MPALMDAVRANEVKRVRELIAQGADVDERDAGGDAPLVIAAYEGYTEIVRLLLEAGADVAAVDPGMQATALHAAAYAGRTEAARLLVEHHVDVDKQGPVNGYTALHDAIWQGHVETARAIISSGANLNLRAHDGQTPFELARARGAKEIVALIEERLARE